MGGGRTILDVAVFDLLQNVWPYFCMNGLVFGKILWFELDDLSEAADTMSGCHDYYLSHDDN